MFVVCVASIASKSLTENSFEVEELERGIAAAGVAGVATAASSGAEGEGEALVETSDAVDILRRLAARREGPVMVGSMLQDCLTRHVSSESHGDAVTVGRW